MILRLTVHALALVASIMTAPILALNTPTPEPVIHVLIIAQLLFSVRCLCDRT